MGKLLFIEASPRGERSHSSSVAKTFIDAYLEKNPSDEVEHFDLWEAELPPFNLDTINAKYGVMGGKDFTAEQKVAWDAVTKAADHFKSADKYVISLPMWNFGIPYQLKQYIDIICQPGLTFGFDPETGYSGLVDGKVLCVFARGGAYSEGDAQSMDFQKPYLEFILGFMGLTDLSSLVVEPTVGSPDDIAAMKEKIEAEARELASTF
ncbi:FMN-dependent NADH-azoreductase [Calycomorphotria hydatis]|uniref:FMN dependent NADH:quinone oxidoreductase n=1 Tax=Calycomorphotria hydatis TaxID=2528027 RepID=A0A517T3V7_9PLAN|nr:NAD(P)H-dependent oxidoreductase [Calycomorphotria hydatis]QDT63060.1 FMN-dependent NADH-azoreductase 1 [Calycomorphotria hydatis]